MSSERMRHWAQVVNEAVEGSTDIDRSTTANLIKYGREAAQFSLPPDYPQIKTAADLMQSLDRFIQQSVDAIKDPMAKSMLSRVANTNPARTAAELDRLAKAPNPGEEPTK